MLLWALINPVGKFSRKRRNTHFLFKKLTTREEGFLSGSSANSTIERFFSCGSSFPRCSSVQKRTMLLWRIQMVRFWRTAQRRVTTRRHCFKNTKRLFEEWFVSRTRRKESKVLFFCFGQKKNGSFLKNRSRRRTTCFKNRSLLWRKEPLKKKNCLFQEPLVSFLWRTAQRRQLKTNN